MTMRSHSLISLVLVVGLACVHTCPLTAQTVNSSEEMQFNMAILSLLDEYELTSMLAEPSDRKTFLMLFEHPESPCVYNDIIGTSSFQKIISAKEYVALVPDGNSLFLQTQIFDVIKSGAVRSEDGRLYRTIRMKKSILVTDATVYTKGDGAVFFDSADQFKDSPDFCLDFELSYNPVRNKCKIVSIKSVDKKSHSPFDEGRFSILLRSSDKYDSQLSTRGEPVTFNAFNQSVIYQDGLVVDNQDVIAEEVVEASGRNYDVISVNYRQIKNRFKVYGGLTPGSAYKLDASYEGIKSKSIAAQIGVDFGFESSINDKWRIGAYVGAAASLSKLNLSVKDVAYQFAYSDISGELLSRDYSFSATESLNLMDVVFPVYLENEFPLSNKVVLDFDLGAKLYLNCKTSLSPYKVVGKMGAAQTSKEYTAFISPALYSRNSYDVAAFANLECDICLKPKFLYAYMLLGYEAGLTPSYDSGSRLYFDEQENVYPFIYSVESDTDLPFRSLVGSTIYTRRSLWLSLGLKLRF